MGMGKIGLIVGNSTKCHEKSMLGKPFCVTPNTCTSYCSPGLSPKNRKKNYLFNALFYTQLYGFNLI